MNTLNIRIETKINSTEYKQILELLNKEYNLKVLPEIDYYFLCYSKKELIGFAAISNRIVIIDNKEVRMNLLGLFIIKDSFRKKGIGSHFIQKIIHLIKENNNQGIILNCGEKIEGFYIKNGFKKISDSAIYLRNNEKVTDNDPVYYLGEKINKEYKTIFWGTDF